MGLGHRNWSSGCSGGSEGEEEEEEEETEECDYSGISDGWEEVHDTIVPSSNYLGSSNSGRERLEYGVSYSDYTLRQGRSQNELPSTAEGVHSSNGLLDTLGSLLGSGWLKKH